MEPKRYKIACISMYHEDIATLEWMVAELKKRGDVSANKSALIRMALGRLSREFAIPASPSRP